MSTRHNEDHAGLQNHSIGDIYPYSIKRIGDRVWVVFHCITGEEFGEFPVSAVESYKQAETLARELLSFDNLPHLCDMGYREVKQATPDTPLAPQELPVLQEYTFLIPNTDKQGRKHKGSYWVSLESALVDEFEGFSRVDGSIIHGSWTSASGSVIQDDSIQYVVAIPSGSYGKLLEIISLAKIDFAQDCIYLCKTGQATLV